jgi:enoyl-CoA hydratase/carnithine racemase
MAERRVEGNVAGVDSWSGLFKHVATARQSGGLKKASFKENAMADELVKVERSGDYLTVRLNRPEKGNAINNAMLAALDAAFAGAQTDKAVRALLLTGEGKHFCAGIDLAEGHRVDTTEVGGGISLETVFHRLEALPMPTVAVMRGAALAGGLELGLHCDLRVAAENARLGMPVARVGLIPPFDFTRKLIEVIGASATAYLLFSGEPIDGKRALAMGMVNEVAPEGEVEAAGRVLLERISGNAPLSLRTIQATLRRCMGDAFGAEHKDLDEMVKVILKSSDAKEGARAFVEKRKPVWKGE